MCRAVLEMLAGKVSKKVLRRGRPSSMFRYMAKYRNRDLEDTIAITKALADEHRVRALMALGRGELCACQLTELLGLAPSTVSRHMSILRQARLVEVRKEGRWSHYRLAEAETSDEARSALDWLEAALGRAPELREDARRLREILKSDPKELCAKSCRK